MKICVAVTDNEWFHTLSQADRQDEVNFWRPSSQSFKVLRSGELFLFKLHAPQNCIAGGGFFSETVKLPSSLAWEAFSIGNGAHSYRQMRERIFKYRKRNSGALETDPILTCIVLSDPFFFPKKLWIPTPSSFAPNIVTYKGYEKGDIDYQHLIEKVKENLRAMKAKDLVGVIEDAKHSLVETPKYGSPVIIRSRLGQGSFRLMTIKAYEGQCAVTGERALPALEAAHIRPYNAGGTHTVDNALLLRSDFHRLFDKGYLSVDPVSKKLLVSKKLKESFQGGEEYYAFSGKVIKTPQHVVDDRPSESNLQYHLQEIFLG